MNKTQEVRDNQRTICRTERSWMWYHSSESHQSVIKPELLRTTPVLQPLCATNYRPVSCFFFLMRCLIPSCVDTDGLISQALLTGNFEAAVDVCLYADRMVCPGWNPCIWNIPCLWALLKEPVTRGQKYARACARERERLGTWLVPIVQEINSMAWPGPQAWIPRSEARVANHCPSFPPPNQIQ